MTKPEGNPKGRPTAYTEEIAKYICAELAAGKSLRAICREENMPSEGTVRLWVTENRDGFSSQYARARDYQMDAMSEEILAIADEENAEDTQRAKLRIDTRKWLMSKMAPKKYGDKLELSGDKESPLQVVIQKYSHDKNSDPE